MMKRSDGKQKVTKGMPSAVLLSIAIHAALFFLAGMLVVFTVVKKKEIEFEPPKAVERPKMKLKKPKVKVRKSSKPKPTTRIVTKVNRASMPDIQLPEMSGMGGDGLGDVMGGFDMMPDLSEVSAYGSVQSIGNDFVGTFYDSKRDRNGRNLPDGMNKDGIIWKQKLYKFFSRGWDTSVFAKYYRAPQKLYATSLVVPITLSGLVPLAFGDEDAVGARWMVHYKGQLVCPVTHTNGIAFRFWGSGDGYIAVRVDGKMVLANSWCYPDRHADYYYRAPVFGSLWEPDTSDSYKYFLGNTYAVLSDRITLEPGESRDMEILLADDGGKSGFFLAVEEEGVEYEENRQGAPILPAFKTIGFSHDLLDAIYKDLPEGEMICLTNGPVFCDYDTGSKTITTPVEKPGTSHIPPLRSNGVRLCGPTSHTPKSASRIWTLLDGRTMEAEFINIFGGKVVLKNAKGRTCKISKAELSAGDVEYAELASPPDFDINFLKNFRHVDFSGGFYDKWARPPEGQGHYGFQIKQTGTGDYTHELQVEMFVVGRQWRRSKYRLLDRQATSFVPSEQEQRIFEFRSGRKVVERLVEYYNSTFGEKHYGYLVTVRDKRGKMVVMKSSHKWLPGILENLNELSAGNFFDETGMRTYPDLANKNPKY
ncbi:MAG: hypothetical protein ABFR33_04680 [Verrucomicrobiota bacterium]